MGDLTKMLVVGDAVSPPATSMAKAVEPQPSPVERPILEGTLVSGLKLKYVLPSGKVGEPISATADGDSTATEEDDDEKEIRKMPRVADDQIPKFNWAKEGLFVPVDRMDSRPPKPKFENMSSPSLGEYHRHQSRGEGAHYVVAKLNGAGYDPNLHRFHKSDLKLQMDIADFTQSLSRGQRDLFGSIVGGIQESTLRRSVAENTPKKRPYTFPKLPDSDKAARQMYGDQSSSFKNILPFPKPEMLREHAYVSLEKIIEDFLANGVGMKSLCPNWEATMDKDTEREDKKRR